MMMMMNVLALLLLIVSIDAFHRMLPRMQQRRLGVSKELKMSASSFDTIFGMSLPLCLEATSKTTTINDPTAGMSAEQITDYMSNVGGGMCGYPEIVRTTIGLGLNLSLIVFGFFTVSYVVLGGYNFALEKGVDESLKAAEANAKRGSAPIFVGGEKDDKGDMDNNSRPSGSTNREKRRMQQRLKKGEKDNN